MRWGSIFFHAKKCFSRFVRWLNKNFFCNIWHLIATTQYFAKWIFMLHIEHLKLWFFVKRSIFIFQFIERVSWICKKPKRSLFLLFLWKSFSEKLAKKTCKLTKNVTTASVSFVNSMKFFRTVSFSELEFEN